MHAGSMRDRRVHSDLQKERDRCNFDQEELYEVFIGGPNAKAKVASWISMLESEPLLGNSHAFYDMSREEQIEN